MKVKNFIRYKNRKLYCKKTSSYVSFDDLIEAIREGYTIGVTPSGELYNEAKAVERGNKYLISCFAHTMKWRSQSSVDLIAHEIYKLWNLDTSVERQA